MKKEQNTYNVSNIPDINRRIFELVNIKTAGIISKFASEIGIQQQPLDRLFRVDKRSGKGNYPIPKPELIDKILNRFPDVNRIWLLTGIGEMTSNLPDKPPDITTQYTPNRPLSQEDMMSEIVLTNKMLAIQHGELIKMLAKHTDSLSLCADTINKNSITISNLSTNTNMSKNVEGQAS
jgi:hypothetical protein